MNMVEIYVAEVGRRLPEKNRADLQQEIRSLIEDAIDDAALTQGRERDEALVVEVLKKFGSPDEVAASYSKPRYLIGPKLFPFYWMVLRIVLAVILVVSSIGVGLEIGQGMQPGQTVFGLIAEVFGSVVGALVAAFGNVVLVFAILERLLPEKTWEQEEWDPRNMTAEPDPEDVKLLDVVLGTVFTLAFLLVLNVYPHWIGISSIVDGRWVSVPFLSQAFSRYLPLINAMMALDVVRYALMLQQGRWTNPLSWLAIGLNLGWIALLAWMLAGPAIIQFNPADLARLGWDTSAVDAFRSAGLSLVTLSRMVLGVALAANVWDLLTKLYRIFTRKSGVYPVRIG